jgi:hypothetical protein
MARIWCRLAAVPAESGMPFVRRVGNFIWANLYGAEWAARGCPARGMRVFRRETRIALTLPTLNFTPVMSIRALMRA